ncbi:MAG: agmatine deiminase family protein [Bacteroidales bacterium]|jgi:agmatine/peptidylarginine deiminase|nr:agmatine deiminase family protein [Bacteroidales bacterium]
MRKTISISFVLIALLISNISFSQVTKSVLKQKKQALLEQREKMSSKEIADYYQKTSKRIPNMFDANNMKSLVKKNTIGENTLKSSLAVPSDMIYPIESDEVQAILMTWIYDTRTLSGAYAEQLFDGWGVPYNGGYALQQVVSAPDVASNSDYAKLFARLANGIQQHAQVWIDVWAAEDTTTIKNYMTNRGTPLTNYRFFIHPGNSFWYRDCGPVAFYYGDNDNIAFMDFEYYGGRPLDDNIPVAIAHDLGYPVYTNTIEYEGGNILLDGKGTLFTSSAVYSNNQDQYGLYIKDSTQTNGYYVQTKTALTQAQVNDSLSHLLNLTRCTVLPALQYDGGTGHIDLYADMWEETGIVASKYPAILSSTSDAKRVESNLDTMMSKKTIFNKGYSSIRIPLPAKNDGSWYSTLSDYNTNYTRSFSNHTFVNDAIMQPVFYDTTLSGTNKGDVSGNKNAMKIFADCYPGYKLEQIDVRAFDGFGGALHCITKQIPAENPIRIYHDPIHWLNTTNINTPQVALNIISQNHSGINNVKVYYKRASESTWNESTATLLSNNMYQGSVTIDLNTTRDTLYYYISSTSNNGKTITKPMTAPQGYYKLVYGRDVSGISQGEIYSSICCQVSQKELQGIGQIYPNPTNNEAKINLSQSLSSNLIYKIVNLKGQVVRYDKVTKGSSMISLNVENLKPGSYWVIFTDGNLSTSRQLVIAK